MTLRTIEGEFAKALLTLNKDHNSWDLTLDGPLSSADHPKIIWARLQSELGNVTEFPAVTIPDWYYETFEEKARALEKFPDAISFRGQPHNIFMWLESKSPLAVVDFDDLGAIVLSKNLLEQKPNQDLQGFCLATWSHYALSPELWGPVGKWTRFHRRLIDLFESKSLQGGNCLPGYYTLLPHASKLKEHGFSGTHLDKSYLLVLPWTFSLSALEKLERIVRQEF